MAKARAPGWWYPWIFVAGMALVVVVNGLLAFLAVDTWTGIATEDHYNKGLAYNDNLAAAKAQAERGWTLDLALTPTAAEAAERTVDLALRFADRDGRPLTGLAVDAVFVRPTHEGFDVDAALGPRGDGVYAATVALPLAGQWDVRVHARRGDDTFQTVRRLVVP